MALDFNKELGQKLKKARERLNMKLQEVATQMDFNHYQIVSSIEDGTRKIKASELAKLSKIYLRDISYFLNPKEEKEDLVVLWRNKQEGSKIKIIEQQFLRYCNNYFDLEERLGIEHKIFLQKLNNYTSSDFNIQSVNKIANEYYRMLQLGSRPACILEKVLEEKYHIKVVYMNLENYASAASAIGKFGTAILINSSERSWRSNYNIAHELFHIITWDVFENYDVHTYCDDKSPVEKWADIFASNILLPSDEVITEFENRIKDEKISIIDLIGIAREFEVSTSALLWRLVNLKRLNKKDVEKLIDDESFRLIDKEHRNHIKHSKTPQISNRYINLAFKAYQKGLISKGKLSDYLNVDRSEVDSELQEYGYNIEEIYEQELTPA